MIKVENLVKNYGSFRAVDDVSFTVNSGEIVGLLGPNGAGKTTIMKVLTGYHYQTAGVAELNEIDVLTSPIEAKKTIGYLPETAPLYTDMTVKEYLSFIADARGLSSDKKLKAIADAVSECGLESVYDRLIDKLSKGFRQRVGLAQAILHSPDILILDEPTTGLDPNQILEIRSLIKKIGKSKTVVLSTHIMQEVEAVCDRVIIINNGRIAAEGTAEEISTELSGSKTIIEAELKGFSAADLKSDAAAVINKLVTIKGASDIEILSVEGGKVSFKMLLEDGDDVQESVFDFAVSQKLKLLALKSKKLNLEEIFVKLTNDTVDGQGGAK